MYFSVLGDFVFGAKKSLSVMVSVQIAMFSQLSRIERLLLLTPAYPNLQVVRTHQARPFHVLKSVFHVDFRTWWSEQVPFLFFSDTKSTFSKRCTKLLNLSFLTFVDLIEPVSFIYSNQFGPHAFACNVSHKQTHKLKTPHSEHKSDFFAPKNKALGSEKYIIF